MKRMLWVDLEMSGLDVVRDRILEVAAIVTDLKLQKLEQLHAIVYQPPDVLEGMDPWCVDHHGRSGLTKACASGQQLAEIEKDLIRLVEKYWDPQEKVILCGNTVGTDRKFLAHWMPDLAPRLHYRVLDVSSFKIVFKEMYGVGIDKGESHRAVQDIEESIAELAKYLTYVKVEKP